MSAVAMTCPHCAAGFLPEGAHRCPLCGQLRSTSQAAIAVAEPPPVDHSAIDALVNAELGSQFRIERALKHGGASHVYFAGNATVGGRDTALKVIVPPAGATAADAERFQAAVQSAAGLDHPNIARPYRHGTTTALWWYAMAYVPAPSVAERLAAGLGQPLDVPLTWRIALQVAGALDYAHRRGLVHGALKSTDVLLDDAGWVHVIDVGMVGSAVTPADDQYRLALLVRECLTGGAQTDGFPPEVAPHVAQVLQRALAPLPAQRFAGVLDFVAALTGAEPQTVGLPPRAPPRGGRRHALLFETEAPAPRPRRRLLRYGVGALAVTGGVLLLRAQPVTRDEVLLGRPPDPVVAAPSLPAPVVATPPPPATPAPAAPRPAPVRAAQPATPPRPRPTQPAGTPGYVSVNSVPWSVLSIDGRPMGTTPRLKVPVSAGVHHFRLQRAGFKTYEAAVVVKEGDTVVITNIKLEPVEP